MNKKAAKFTIDTLMEMLSRIGNRAADLVVEPRIGEDYRRYPASKVWIEVDCREE